MEFNGLKQIYTSKGLLNEEYELSLIEKLYNFTFGSNEPKKYTYNAESPIQYKEGDIVYIQNDETSEVVYYKATNDTIEEITDSAVDWKPVTVSTAGSGDIGDAIIVADEQPTNTDNKVWYDQIAMADMDIPADL